MVQNAVGRAPGESDLLAHNGRVFADDLVDSRRRENGGRESIQDPGDEDVIDDVHCLFVRNSLAGYDGAYGLNLMLNKLASVRAFAISGEPNTERPNSRRGRMRFNSTIANPDGKFRCAWINND